MLACTMNPRPIVIRLSMSFWTAALKNNNVNAVQINRTKSIDGARSVSPLMMAKNDGIVAACSRMIESHPSVSADVCPNFPVMNLLNFSKLNFSMIIYQLFLCRTHGYQSYQSFQIPNEDLHSRHDSIMHL